MTYSGYIPISLGCAFCGSRHVTEEELISDSASYIYTTMVGFECGHHQIIEWYHTGDKRIMETVAHETVKPCTKK